MENTLLSTTILAVASFASAASAAEWNVRVGGYYNAMVAYASSDTPTGTDFDGVDVRTDAEVFFLPSITLDNGIRIGANIQLEGNTDGDQIDEAYAFIRGSFGEAIIGSENSAGYLMHYGAPNVAIISLNSGSLTDYIPYSGSVGGVNTGNDIFRATLGTTYIENSDNNDASRITYFTPRFAGFQLGVSYARDPGQGNGPVNNNNQLHDIFDVGANYVNEFGNVDVAVSGRWGTASDPFSGRNPEIWGFGANIGFVLGAYSSSYGSYPSSFGTDGRFIIGGSFAEQDGTQASDGHAYDIGLGYETGPWAFSFNYFHGQNIDNEHAAFGIKEELDRYIIAMDYEFTKGVNVNLFAAYADFDEALNDAAAPGGDDVDGFIIGTGFRLTF